MTITMGSVQTSPNAGTSSPPRRGHDARVLQWLSENPGPQPPRAIAAGTDLKVDATGLALRRLRTAGEIDATGSASARRYVLAGHAAIPDELDPIGEPEQTPAAGRTTFGKGREIRGSIKAEPKTSPEATSEVASGLERARRLDAQIRGLLEDGKPRTAKEIGRELFRNFQEVHLRLQAGAARRVDGGLWANVEYEESACA